MVNPPTGEWWLMQTEAEWKKKKQLPIKDLPLWGASVSSFPNPNVHSVIV